MRANDVQKLILARRSDFLRSSMKIVNQVIRSHTGLIRLYFDGVYQERKNHGKIDVETGEIL